MHDNLGVWIVQFERDFLWSNWNEYATIMSAVSFGIKYDDLIMDLAHNSLSNYLIWDQIPVTV